MIEIADHRHLARQKSFGEYSIENHVVLRYFQPVEQVLFLKIAFDFVAGFGSGNIV